MYSVAAFTDTYLPTVNGVTYTVKNWRDCWQDRGGRMDVVYPGTTEYDPDEGEYPVRSIAFPFYEGFRIGVPRIPDPVEDADLVHAHTPFMLGLAGLRLARRTDRPFVATYHTPVSEYAAYLTGREPFKSGVEWLSEHYERWFLDRADAVIVPSDITRRRVRESVDIDTEIVVVPNGVDIGRFRPTDGDAFRERYDLGDGPLIGYTGRHGYEKQLGDLLDAAEDLEGVTIVFGGDGPARDDLEAKADEIDLDIHFLGFLDREELPAFYSALDVFAFPSPVETQGLVALEANACGTPVVGVDSGALADTIVDGVTGYHYASGDIQEFCEKIRLAIDEQERLRENCLDRRDEVSVEHAVDRLHDVYDQVCSSEDE